MRLTVLALVIALSGGCESGGRASPDRSDPGAIETPPYQVMVEHILIAFRDAPGFRGKPPHSASQRTKQEAEILAKALLERARTGTDFAELASSSDDRRGTTYAMSNYGEEVPEGFSPRTAMTKSFGDVAFSLRIGEVGLAAFHADDSPYGWHVILRIE
ncbi:MAG: hypothetical protein CMJ83_10455 [Planctomycetes bacterium]|nr:hypothetical protein [Planctomycetota bacterium]